MELQLQAQHVKYFSSHIKIRCADSQQKTSEIHLIVNHPFVTSSSRQIPIDLAETCRLFLGLERQWKD